MKKQQAFCESYSAKAQYLCTIDDRLFYMDQDLIERNLDKVIRGSEILHGLSLIKGYLYSLYKYRYADFT
ncbi:unnamed protein product [Adineta steineri]|uniref:Uncharacterized protein n=1 Tax=Adineta steineri TaxID=433720 RepID=A0A818GQA5_9BILA|nr:unnamed protein product [Adineta steineri]